VAGQAGANGDVSMSPFSRVVLMIESQTNFSFATTMVESTAIDAADAAQTDVIFSCN
jgi:hypothetical protein